MRLTTLLTATLVATLSASAQLPSNVPSDGLVGWYSLEGSLTNSVNPSEVASGSATLLDSAAFFDNTELLLPNSSLPAEFSISFEFWVDDLDVQGGQYPYLIGLDESEVPDLPGIGYQATPSASCGGSAMSKLFLFDGATGCTNVFSSTTIITEGGWNRVSISKGTSNLIIQLNGEAATYFGAVSFNIDQIRVGNRQGGLGFQGHLRRVGLWNRALSDVEITSIYSETPPLFGCTDASACNYDAAANADDSNCAYGCLFCGAGTHWDPVTEMCIADVPGAVEENCTLMNLQELAAGYQVLLDNTAYQDSIILAQQAWIDSAQGNISNSPTGPCSGENSLNYFGQDYDIVEINGRCWFGDNLNTSQYSNGDSLATNVSISMWNGTSIGACDAYGFSSINADTYGLLYNWHAVTDPRNLCPTGWHVASDSDWKSAEIGHGMTPEEADLTNFRGSPAGSRFKANYSNSPSWNGTDSLHFGGLPGGWRNENGSFSGLGTSAAWWTNSGYGCCYAQYRIMTTNEDRVFRNNLYYYFFGRASSGLSVRCVKD